YCVRVSEKYDNLDSDSFAELIKSFVGYDENIWSELHTKEDAGNGNTRFANRLITGLAAEQYFESVQPIISEFRDYVVENTTRLGCGYDFRLRTEPTCQDFIAVEVKGLRGPSGSVSITAKEHGTAAVLRDRFFPFIVKNFQDRPFHQIFQDPLSGTLHLTKTEIVTVQVAWLAKV